MTHSSELPAAHPLVSPTPGNSLASDGGGSSSKRKCWSPDEDATLRRMIAAGASYAEIAAAIGNGRTRSSTKERASKIGLRSEQRSTPDMADARPWTPENIDEVRNMLAAGMSRKQVADATGRGFHGIKHVMKLHGIRANSSRPINTPACRPDVWTADEDARLKSLILDGLTYRQIADVMGRSVNALESRAFKKGLSPRKARRYANEDARREADNARRREWRARKAAARPHKERAVSPLAWTPDETATLVKMIGDAKTFAEIGKSLGKSRSSVAGMARRQGLKGCAVRVYVPRAKPAPKPKVIRTVRQRAARIIVAGREVTSLPIDMAIYADEPMPLICEGLPDSGSCKWPHGDGPFLFCGQPARGAYCGHHSARAYAGLPVLKPARKFVVERARW